MTTLEQIYEEIKNTLSIEVSNAALVFIKDKEKLERLIESRSLKTNPTYTFSRLRNVKITPTYLFGSNIKTEVAQELTVCNAVLDSTGAWIPDESDILLSCLLTDEAVTSMIFNGAELKPSPATATMFNNSVCNYFGNDSQRKEQYLAPFLDHENQLKRSFDEVLEITNELELNKRQLTNKQKSRLNILMRSLLNLHNESGTEYDIKSIRLNLEKDSLSLKSEVLASIKGRYIKNSPLAIENTSEKPPVDSVFLQCFNVYSKKENKENVLHFLKAARTHIRSDSHFKGFEKNIDSLIQTINRLVPKDKSDPRSRGMEKSQVGQIGIILNKTSGSGGYFGCLSEPSTVFGMTFHHAYTEVDHYGNKIIEPSSRFLDIFLTQEQMREMLQMQKWVNTTISRYSTAIYTTEKFVSHNKEEQIREFTSKNKTNLLSLCKKVVPMLTEDKLSQEERLTLVNALKGITSTSDDLSQELEHFFEEAVNAEIGRVRDLTYKDIDGIISQLGIDQGSIKTLKDLTQKLI
ncbi:hypothetical protein [Photobacterium kishitanii]|uniref:Uncharacterized protein n=1 Tax=Photobacterium kishitanii TaxID=318456 RepID=A0A2T3KLG5_9GAMM|nr:hypothetical protein [Photobacterium kishitanii]PSV00531.1 hypothetical protein C9J27_05195 [Photobacterium kishitanii]